MTLRPPLEHHVYFAVFGFDDDPLQVTLVAGVVAVAAGWQEEGSVVDVLALSAMFAGLYAASAWLFRSAAPRPA